MIWMKYWNKEKTETEREVGTGETVYRKGRNMKSWLKGICEDIRELCQEKWFAAGLFLMMVISYATLLHNPTIGIDDTAFDVYYEEGVSPAMGRWVLYLLNKVFPLEYNPYMVEGVGLLCLCISALLWCVVFYRLFGDRISRKGYLAFACVMVSSPIMSELVVWYLQDGIYLGYGATALSVLMGMKAFSGGKTASGRQWKALLLSGVLLTVALGFYESFMIVWIMGMFMCFFLCRMLGKEDYSVRPLEWCLKLPSCVVLSIVLRTVIVKLMILVFGLQQQTQVLRSRGLHEFFGWFDGSKNLEDFLYVMKDFLVKYYINGVVYFPITVLVFATAVVLAAAVRYSVKRKDGWILAAAIGMLLVPWIMPVLEGIATYYRTSQYIPVLTAFGMLLLIWELGQWGKLARWILTMAVAVLLYRQAYEMNRWLYLDAMKYEDAKRTMDQVALVIQREHDATKPVCIIGHYQVPESLVQEAYCPSWSKKYLLVEFFVKRVDESLFEEYNTPYGYAFAETPRLSVLNWGATAFYGFDREAVKFWRMQGITLYEDGDQEHYVEAREMMKDGPVWPQEGSVVEMDDYIIVNFGNETEE